MNSDSKRVVFEIEYEVLLSPSYYIPVLYFSVRDSSGQMVTEIEQIYALIVPAIYRSQMQSIGVMGGLSMAVSKSEDIPLYRMLTLHQNHPVTGIPTFFIHPCQTADALREVAGGRNVSHQEYILLWLGIVGGSVGLNAPLFLGTQQA
jgi:ubiquitin-like-conjugating enzyme ATG10